MGSGVVLLSSDFGWSILMVRRRNKSEAESATRSGRMA